MQYWLLLITLMGTMAWGQVTTYNLNNDNATHGFSLPIPCPSTTGGNCQNAGTQNNQATVGANSIWAECDFSGSSSFPNPECSGGQLAASSSSAAGTYSQYVHIVRATDANTQSATVNWAGTCSGGAGDVTWDSTATRIVLCNQSAGVVVPFSFDPNPASPTYMQVARLYGRFYVNSGTSAFSKITPHLFYALQNSDNVPGLVGTSGVHAHDFVVMSYDFTSATTAPTLGNGINLVVDYNNACSHNSFPAYGSTGLLGVSDDDQTFSADLNGSLGQDNYGYVVVWNRTLGCTELETDTGIVTHFDGTTGTIVNANSLTGIDWPVKYYVHESQTFHDGGKFFIQSEYCVTGNNCDGANGATAGTNYVWETGVPYPGHPAPTGLNVYPMLVFQNGVPVDGSFQGHSMQGYTLWTSQVDTGLPRAEWFMHTATSVPGTSVALDPNAFAPQPCYQPGANPYYCPFIDSHDSWANNINSADTAPIFSILWDTEATSSTNNLVPDTPMFPMGEEITIMPTTCYPSSCTSNKPWRVTHTYSTPEPSHAASFYSAYGTGAVSSNLVDGHYFFMWTSDWMGQLGCPDGSFANGPWGAGCPTGIEGPPYANVRSDVFIAAIPVAVAGATLTPSSVNFGNQAYGTTSSPQAITLTNSQTSALNGISVSISGTNAGDFAQANNCGTSLAANSSCAINITFTPSGYGSRTATVSVTDSAGMQTSSLTGTGQDVTPPTTRITAPANNATVSGTVTVTATATDNVGVTSIQIYIDGTLKSSGSVSPLNYSWNTTTATNGSHTIYSKAYDAAGNIGTSPTITVTVNNSSTQLIQNPGFETGNLANWTASGTYLPFVTVWYAHSGTHSAQLGASMSPEPVSDSALYQTVTIPSTATSATLDYYYSGVTTDTIAHDWQEAQIQDNSGRELAQVMKTCSNTLSWQHVTFNLIAYKGQTIRIYFNTHQNGNGKLTYMYVDDVSVTVR